MNMEKVECLYDENGKILTYKYGSVDFETCEVHEFDIENYKYASDGLAVDWHYFMDCWRKPRFGYRYHYWCNKYYFSVVDGYLSTYTTEYFTEQGKQESVWDGHIF